MSKILNIYLIISLFMLTFQINGFSDTDFESADESYRDQSLKSDVFSSDESDYWDMVARIKENIHEPYVSTTEPFSEGEMWNKIDSSEFSSDESEVTQFRRISNVRGVGAYTFGQRIQGDNVVASSVKNESFPTYRDVITNFTYPLFGIGKKLSYVAIIVDQTGDEGRCDISRGGPGYHFMTVIIRAYNVLQFNFIAKFYGL